MFTLRRRWQAAAITTVIALAGSVVLTSSGVSAAGTVDPSITGDPNAANGTISFYDASGNQISSGPLSAPFTAYAVASSATTKTGTPKATLFVAAPDHTKANSLQWFNQQLTAASTWPLAGAPAGVAAAEGAGAPAVAIGAGDGDLAGAFAGAVNDPSTGFDHIMQVRMEDSGPGKPAGAPFWQADLYIDTVAGTWTQLYPTPSPTKTVTSFSAINASPASPAAHGSTVTLTSTLSAADSAHPAGAVELFDGATDKGAATFTAATGAVTATDTPADGSHSYTFKFTPTDTTNYAGTTSAPASYTVNGPVATTTALAVSPASPSTFGDTVTLTATVTPSSAAGTVQFLDGATNLGAPVTVAAGTASTTTSTLAIGSHSLTAKFIPASGGSLTSTSAVKAYTVNSPPATTTTSTLAISPSGPVDFGTAVTLTATVSTTSAAGTVQFLDGATNLGAPVTVSGGTASSTISTLASGVHSLTAKFLPADPAVFGTSTSTATSLTVNAQSTSTVLAVTPASPVDHGQSVTLKATVTPSGATGTVSFFDGASQLGSPAPVSGGTAQLSTSTLTVATHSLTATFTPTSAAQFATSTSAPVSLVVQNPPPGATTLALAATPTGSVVSGTAVTLKATVAPSAAAGTIQFAEGGTNFGVPVTVSAGVASTTVTPTVGTHSYTATFTPTDPVSYQPSTSPAVSVVVIPPPTPTTTTLTITPAGPVDFGTAVTFDATVTATTPGDPAPTGGTVQFKDGSTVLGSAALAAGAASFTTSTLGGGVHSITASYSPADATAFAASTSAAGSLTVNAQPSTTTLAVAPAGKVTEGNSVSLTATVSPAGAAGSITFSDGTTSIGTAAVTAGKATLATTTLAVGDHSFTAAFTPTDSTAFGPSTSSAVSLTVVKAPTIGTATVNGKPVSSGSQLKPGDTVTITGSDYQPGESVKVVLTPGTTVLAAVTADSSGNVSATVTLPSTLSAGAHTLTLQGSLASATFRFTVAGPTGTPTPTSTAPSASASSSEAGSGSTSGGGLASTGAQVTAGLSVAVLLMIAGAGVLLSTRRRRSH
ncbi:MAG: Ig-like domain-containing protein [Jatrophihabitantaceae bacterium]